LIAAEHVITGGPCDNWLGALLTVSEMAICPVAKGAVEIALAVRHFGIGSFHIAHASCTFARSVTISL
jgi:hypothetical protein